MREYRVTIKTEVRDNREAKWEEAYTADFVVIPPEPQDPEGFLRQPPNHNGSTVPGIAIEGATKLLKSLGTKIVDYRD